MFERFTDRGRRVVVLAQEEARTLNHSYVGTEHILLGLIREGNGVACKALEAIGITLEEVRREVVARGGEGQDLGRPTGHTPFTPGAKKTLELALREADQLGHAYIGTEHLLLGLLREGEGVAYQVLARFGADLDSVRAEVTKLMASEKAGAGSVTTEARQFRHIVRLGSAPVNPERFPICSICHTSLAGSLRFRILDAQQHEGETLRRLLVLYCGSCGSVVGSVTEREQA